MEHIPRIHRLRAHLVDARLVDFTHPPLAELWRAVSDAPWRVVFLGNYNAGKSTLINALLHEERIEVGMTPTTRGLHEYQVADGLVVVDTPGFEDPDQDADKILANAVKQAECLVLVLTHHTTSSDTIYQRIASLCPARPVYVVVNLQGRVGEDDQLQLQEEATWRIRQAAPRLELQGVFCVNASSALRGAVGGKPRLLHNSGIGRLRSALLREHRRFRQDRDVELLQTLVQRLEQVARYDPTASRLYAEARTISRLLQGAVSHILPVRSRLSVQEAAWISEQLGANCAEIRPAGNGSYMMDMSPTDRPILENVTLRFDEMGGCVALVGLEFRNSHIKRSGSTLMLLDSCLSSTPVVATNRANVWATDCSFERSKPAVTLQDRSWALIQSSTFGIPGGLVQTDASSLFEMRGCHRPGGSAPHSEKSTWSLEPLAFYRVPQVQRAFSFRGHTLILQRDTNQLLLMEDASQTIRDRFFLRDTESGRVVKASKTSLFWDERMNLIVWVYETQATFLSVCQGRFVLVSKLEKKKSRSVWTEAAFDAGQNRLWCVERANALKQLDTRDVRRAIRSMPGPSGVALATYDMDSLRLSTSEHFFPTKLQNEPLVSVAVTESGQAALALLAQYEDRSRRSGRVSWRVSNVTGSQAELARGQFRVTSPNTLLKPTTVKTSPEGSHFCVQIHEVTRLFRLSDDTAEPVALPGDLDLAVDLHGFLGEQYWFGLQYRQRCRFTLIDLVTAQEHPVRCPDMGKGIVQTACTGDRFVFVDEAGMISSYRLVHHE